MALFLVIPTYQLPPFDILQQRRGLNRIVNFKNLMLIIHNYVWGLDLYYLILDA